MIYQSLEDHLDTIFESISLSKEDKYVMKLLYLNPGMTVANIEEKSTITKKNLESLKQKGFLLFHKEKEVEGIYPIPLAVLCVKVNPSHHGSNIIQSQDALKNIDKWVRYPAILSQKTKLKTSNIKETIMRWLFDIHQTEWDSVYCFGDYEAFIKDIGIDPEVEWIKERAKKGRTAMVLATQDGEWAQRINSLQQQELRDCCIHPGEFSDLFIMSFPDIYTTLIAGKDNDVTFIHSKSISQHYASIVKKGVSSD